MVAQLWSCVLGQASKRHACSIIQDLSTKEHRGRILETTKCFTCTFLVEHPSIDTAEKQAELCNFSMHGFVQALGHPKVLPNIWLPGLSHVSFVHTSPGYLQTLVFLSDSTPVYILSLESLFSCPRREKSCFFGGWTQCGSLFFSPKFPTSVLLYTFLYQFDFVPSPQFDIYLHTMGS